MKAYSICLSLSDISLSVISSKSIMLSQLAKFYSFLWLVIFLCIYTHTHSHIYISSRSIHMRENWGCFYISSLLEIMLQWPFGCIHIFELAFLFSSDRYPWMKLTNYIIYVHAKSLQSCPTLCNLIERAPGSSVSGSFPGKNTGVGCHFLLQGIFLTQGSKLKCLLHWRWLLYHWATWETPNYVVIIFLLFWGIFMLF